MLRLTAFLIAAFTPSLLPAQDMWARADSMVVRLEPSQFPMLPSAVRADLERRGCRIPQVPGRNVGTASRNVIVGAFTGAGQRDWAVLCSIRQVSRILVYRRGGASATDSLAERADRSFIQSGMGPDGYGFSRVIEVADVTRIRRAALHGEGSPAPKTINHAGIVDAFLDKASEFLYFHRGRWLRLQGAD